MWTKNELIELLHDRDRKVDATPEPIGYLEVMRQRALADERAGRCIVMRDPKIRPRPPRKPSWER